MPKEIAHQISIGPQNVNNLHRKLGDATRHYKGPIELQMSNLHSF